MTNIGRLQLCIKLLNLVGFNDGSHQFMFDKQLMFAVRLALEAGFLLYRVIRTVTRRRSLLQRIDVFHKSEWFEHRPVVQKNNLNLKSLNHHHVKINYRKLYQLK